MTDKKQVQKLIDKVNKLDFDYSIYVKRLQCVCRELMDENDELRRKNEMLEKINLNLHDEITMSVEDGGNMHFRD